MNSLRIYRAENYIEVLDVVPLKRAQIEFARSRGCKEIWTNVASKNRVAVCIQQKLGFALEQRCGGYIARLALRV